MAALSNADRVIGRLVGEGWRFPDSEIFIIPFLRREAVLSSWIEGTRTTLEELLAAQAGVSVGRRSEDHGLRGGISSSLPTSRAGK